MRALYDPVLQAEFVAAALLMACAATPLCAGKELHAGTLQVSDTICELRQQASTSEVPSASA